MDLHEHLTDLADTSKADETETEYETLKPCLIRQEEFIKDLGYKFRNNIVRDTIEFTRDGKNWQDFTSFDINDIARDFELSFEKKKGDKEANEKRVDRLVYNRKMSPPFDIFKSFFQENKWDGKYRFEKLVKTITIKNTELRAKGTVFSTSEIFKEMFTRWMVAAVHCALGNGPNGVMLLLISPNQGTYKTKWLERLCPPYLDGYSITGHIVPDLKDQTTVNALAEKFIINIDDQLDTIMGKDVGTLKSIITNSFTNNRKAYRRDDKKRIRRANFVGSVNSTEIFRDHQNRRYMAFEIESINWVAAQEFDMNQVWAEVYNLYKGGAKFYFDKEDESIINALAEHHSFITAEEEWFSRLFIPSDKSDLQAIPYFPTEVLSIIRKASHLNVYERNLATALKKMGISKVKMRLKGYQTPRDVYMLRENFKRDGDKIEPIGMMNYEETNGLPATQNEPPVMQMEIDYKAK
jgi:predicted P-loop ATPase